MEEGEKNSDIVIGGETVAPGQSKLVKISIDRLPTGTLIDIPVYVYNSTRPGPRLLVQAGLHGDEINGIEIVRRMLQENRFQVLKGAVIAVPILNIFGFIHFSRDVPDGKDVNRSFPGTKKGSLASRIAYHHVHEIMHQMDYAIDLHTGGAQRYNYPQIRYTFEDERSKELARIFNAPFSFASRLIKGSFRGMSYRLGKPTLVYEAGESTRFEDYAIMEGIRGILNLLRHFGMITENASRPLERKGTVFLTDRKWLRAPTAGMFIPEVTNGGQIQKGQLMGMVTDTYARNAKKVRAPFDGYVISINHQAVVNQGDALFHIGKQLQYN